MWISVYLVVLCLHHRGNQTYKLLAKSILEGFLNIGIGCGCLIHNMPLKCFITNLASLCKQPAVGHMH